jgi:hypothetical protein
MRTLRILSVIVILIVVSFGGIISKNQAMGAKTEKAIETSVNQIIPYNQTTSPIHIDVTGPSDLDNVTLYYRYSPDNISWELRGTLSSVEHNCTRMSSENTSWKLLYPNDLIIYNNGTADLAVIATYRDNGLSIWDLTDTGNPIFVGSITGGHLSKTHDVKVWNNGTADLAVVLTYNGYLTIVNITNPASPKEVGHLYDHNHLNKGFSLVIEKEGDYCYAYTAAAASNCTTIYNITKATPVFMGSCHLNGYLLFVEKYYADYIHVSGRNSKTLTVVDVSDKTNPTIYGNCSLGEQGWGHCKYENYIYQVTGNDDSLVILNVTSSAIPTYVSKISGTGAPNHLSAPVGVRIYPIGACRYALVTVAGIDDGLTVINVTDPSHPTYVTGIYGVDAPYYMFDPHAIEVLDRNIYLLMYHNSSAPYSFTTLWLNVTNLTDKWTEGNDLDTTYPWDWDFDFPNGYGYYEFYSIGRRAGETELPPEEADTRCLFGINTPPYIPRNPLPEDGSSDNSIDMTIHWTGGDPDVDDSVTYDVYFGTTNPPHKLISNQSNTYYQVDVLKCSTTYYWYIVSWDKQGTSTAGPIWSFTTIQQQPYKLSFIYGRITNTNRLEEVITFDAVKTWEITFLPLKVSKCVQNDRIVIEKQYFGLLGARFIVALCRVSDSSFS